MDRCPWCNGSDKAVRPRRFGLNVNCMNDWHNEDAIRIDTQSKMQLSGEYLRGYNAAKEQAVEIVRDEYCGSWDRTITAIEHMQPEDEK